MSRTYSAGIVTAYGAAVSAGYTGTYAQFCADLASLADVLAEFNAFAVQVSTLPEGSSATASYEDGTLSLGIPKGDTGATGATGATGPQGVSITSITKTGSAGLVDTYTIALSNGNSSTFTVTNGEQGDQGVQGVGIVDIEKTGTAGLVDTYTVTLSDGNTYTFTVTNGADGEVSQAEFDDLADEVADLKTSKANKDGRYEQLTAGNALQLESTVYETDSAPYLFRTSGGSIDIGDRETDEIVGGSLVWNQLWGESKIPQSSNLYSNTTYTANNVTFTKNGDGSISIQTTEEGASAETSVKISDQANFPELNTHVCWIRGAKGGSETTYLINFGTSRNVYGEGKIYNGFNGGFNMWIRVMSGTILTAPVKVYPQFFDLTATFGSVIASYIASVESGTSGAGVALAKKWANIVKDYYPYSVNTMQSVTGLVSHKMTGFNQWDEVWDNGAISNATGQNTTGTNVRSKNYVPVLPNTVYYLKAPNTMGVFAYDASKAYLEKLSVSTSGTFTTPSGCYYLRFFITTGYGSTYKNDVCINFHWDGERDGEYEAYQERVYTLDDSITLRGIPKLDANNNLYYDGDVYSSDGKITRKYGIVDLGSITWSTSSNRAQCAFASPYNAKLPSSANQLAVIVTEKQYTQVKANGTLANEGEFALLQTGNLIFFYSGTTPSGYMLYELNTQTEETADPFTNPQIVDDWGTEEYVISSADAHIINVGHNTKYQPNLRAKLEMSPDSPSGDGDYIVRQSSGENTYVPLEKELPTLPTANGTYKLKCTVTGGVPTLTWESE